MMEIKMESSEFLLPGFSLCGQRTEVGCQSD